MYLECFPNFNAIYKVRAKAPDDTAYKWSCHNGFGKLLCKLCRNLSHPAMGARFPVFLQAGHADSLDGWRCSS